ncbi:MAG: hypothetical protein AAB432_01375 [Patescibacteria group bacterium]
MSQGNLIKTSYSEITATLELLDRLGVTAEHLAAFRKASSWQHATTAAVIAGDPYLLAILALEVDMKKAGFSIADINKILNNEHLTLLDFFNVLRGIAEIKPIPHVIDCDANPFVPDGWKVEEHQKGGQFKWDPKAIELYLSKPQRKGKTINGNDLREELKNKSVLNANVLDYLLKNSHLIPEEWKGKLVFFWGTIYRASVGRLRVRYLRWGVGGWRWSWRWLGVAWDGARPAALRA